MYLLRMTSLIFALGLLVARLFAAPVEAIQTQWDDNGIRTYQVDPFNKVYLEGTFKVVLEQGSQSGLRIKTDEDNYKYIDVQSDAQSQTLKITKKHFDFELFDDTIPIPEKMQPESKLIDQLERKRIQKALMELPENQRFVVILRFIEDWNNEEVSKALQKPVGTIKALQHRALTKLRKSLS